jgi:hypothetical protein
MSLDKFVMRGFTGSVGSGEGRWVASSSPNASSNSSASQSSSGSSFVMGGSGVRPQPSGANSGSKNSYSEYDSSRGEAMGGGDRYSYDPNKVRDNGTQHKYGQHPGCFGSRSFNEAINTTRGHKFVLSIVLYGIVLFITIFCLIALFGDGKNEDFYSAPGVLRKTKPMWARDR